MTSPASSEPAPGPQQHAPAGTAIGHVHLQVAELAEIEAFYAGVLGFDVMVRGYPGALFVAAGGYHHHLGLNTWHSAGSPAAASRMRSAFAPTRSWCPMPTELARAADRLTAAGATVGADPEHDGLLTRDPSGNAVLLRAA